MKLTACRHSYGNEVKYTKRYKFGQLVGSQARHLLLMTATPHNGNDADFQLFMGLLDPDRFEGRPREGARKVDVSDLMRRLTKEELYRFDGNFAFPERLAWPTSTVPARSRPLPSGHNLCARGDEPRRSLRRWKAPDECRLRLANSSASPCVLTGRHPPLAGAATEAA